MKKTLVILFLCSCPVLTWSQDDGECDSLFFTDGSMAFVDDVKKVKDGLQYRLCGEKYGLLYEVRFTDIKRISYSDGSKAEFLKGDSPVKVNVSIVPEELDTSRTWHIEMIDGNEYYGKVLRKESRFFVFQSIELGEINLPYAKIKQMSLKDVPRKVGNKYWFENPHATRYFFGTNGYGLKKGEGYYTNTWVFYNQVSYGFTDHLTIGVGTIPLFLFGASIFPFWVTPKVSFPLGNDKWNGAAGVLYMNVLGSEVGDFSGLGVTYGSFTYGSKDKNTTFSFGYGFFDGEWAKNPTVSLSGMYRVGRNGYFITENYLLPGADSPALILSAGGRWVGRRIAIDFALARPFIFNSESLGYIGIPWLSITAPFGGKN